MLLHHLFSDLGTLSFICFNIYSVETRRICQNIRHWQQCVKMWISQEVPRINGSPSAQEVQIAAIKGTLTILKRDLEYKANKA